MHCLLLAYLILSFSVRKSSSIIIEVVQKTEFMTPQQLSDSHDKIITEVDVSHLAIEDDVPVDNFQSEKQQRLLVEPLYSSQVLAAPFLAAANVGLFYQLKTEPIVPDVFLSLGVQVSDDLTQKRNRSYFVGVLGKPPEVCIEIVSNREGNELTLDEQAQREGKKVCKKDIYSQIPINYYVVFDPLKQIQDEDNMAGALLRVWRFSKNRYVEITPRMGIRDVNQSTWLEEVGLGLTLWSGQFEERFTRLWLRWCDRDGQVIPTGSEATEYQRQQAEYQRQQAEFERQQVIAANQRAERLAAQLRALGITPD
jgi:hypothetical protein